MAKATECPVCGRNTVQDIEGEIECTHPGCSYRYIQHPDFIVECWECGEDIRVEKGGRLDCYNCGEHMPWAEFEAAQSARKMSKGLNHEIELVYAREIARQFVARECKCGANAGLRKAVQNWLDKVAPFMP